MISVSGEEMKLIDKYCIKNLGIPGIVLMENAALKVLKNIEMNKYNTFVIVCGVGNNGGDGLALGRHLMVQGKKARFFILGNMDRGSNDFSVNYNIIKNINGDIVHINSDEELSLFKDSIIDSDIIIDSIFGTGLTRNVEGIFKDVILSINKSEKYVISIDIPSGLDGNTGKILGICVKASKTITFQLLKRGLMGMEELAGEIIVEPIGIPNMVIDSVLGENLKK
ncbi:NAD(P)H-hydrate epimerase [Sporanaerobacter sp. PP17-6a]|uniref:NAD(P)H-hydrate epimerase n=1 Tax=Sporanaerobacter sp. PP17-6a TaxID=1891289 RepID=UPI00089FAEC3|nr:NAD(P)H-hydrate epimerase [Sporanaerobacter sp. PP17-6a]SCL92172.1 Nicotinamide nucleotide repair protein [Sporanaerobacter sp. PP17-6a]